MNILKMGWIETNLQSTSPKISMTFRENVYEF